MPISKKIKTSCYAISLIIILISLFIFFYWSRFINTPLNLTQSNTTFIIKPGSSLKNIAYNLEKDKLIQHPKLFIFLAKLNGSGKKIIAGQYAITPNLTPPDFLTKIINGQVITHHITLVEGWSFKQDMALINNNKWLKHSLKNLDSKQIMQKLGHPNQSPEGRFFPNTYRIIPGMTDTQLLQKSYLLMEKHVAKLWKNRPVGLWYRTPYQAIIVASMVEKETGVNAEKPIIAGIILKRLRKNMLLQIDASVIYGLGDKYQGKLTRKDLASPSPYNTYLNKYLPPTAICMPGEASLIASLHPKRTDYLYYVSMGNGRHVFSKNLAEQREMIKKYILTKKKSEK